MGKTKFQTSWQTNRPWLVKDKDNIYAAHCTACNSHLNIQAGVGIVKSHENTKSHIDNVKILDGAQAKFSGGASNFFMQCKSRKVTLTSQQQGWNACILRALNVVDKNYSFNSCSGDNDLYKRMFPDSTIASNYQQQKTKVSYVLEFGILPYIIDLVKSDITNVPFTFHFDETTTSQVKKQYDGYATYFSQKHKEVRTVYCGSLFVGRCTADDLVVHFYEFMKKAGLDTNFMLGLGMDGPNVNLSFQNKLLKEITIITVGTCSLHGVNSGFGKAVKSLKEGVADFDQMALDFNFFFKYSASRREQYSKCFEITGVISKMLEKHCESRWLSLEKVLVKLSEQWVNVTEYFLNKVPTLPYFTGKTGVGATPRYGRLKGYLNNKDIPVVMAFLVYFAQDFKVFIKSMETSQPMIHLLFQKCMKLLKSVFGKFLKKDVYLKGDDSGSMKSVIDLQKIDLKMESNHLASCSYGSRTEVLMKNLDQLEKKRVKQIMKEAMIKSAHYLLNNLPINEQVVYDAQFLGPQKRLAKKGVNAVKRLSFEVVKALSPAALKTVFRLKHDENQDMLLDRIAEEYKLYQVEDIPKSFIEGQPEVKKVYRASYWKYAYQLLDINIEDFSSDSNLVRIDHYWNNVGSICDEEGKPKFPNLCIFAKCCVSTLSHGNADPERGFSITNQQLDLHSDNLSENMLVAIRTIKDYLIQNGGLSGFEITVDLITRCQNSHAQYLIHEAEMQKLKKETVAANEAQKTEHEKDDQTAVIESQIGLLQSGVRMSEKLAKEGQEEMKKLLMKKVLDREALTQANEKVTAGMKRKEELSTEIKELEKKKKKYN